MISTTDGWVSEDELGFTLMHEHLVVLSPGIMQAFPFLFDRDAIVAKCIADLEAARMAGVRTVVDCTTHDIGREPDIVLEAAQAAGVQVVLSTGLHRQPPPYFRPAEDRQSTNRSANEAAEVFVREIQEGVGRTGIRAGVIKVASHEYVTPEQEVVLRGAARASLATGAPITTHTLPAARTGLRQIEILQEEQVPMSRVAIGHSITHDIEYLERVYAAGCFVSWDSYLYTAVLPPEERNSYTKTLNDLVSKGYASQTLLGHDYYAFSDHLLPQDENMTYISRVVLPQLRSLGASDESIHAMTIDAPRRFLASGAGIHGPRVSS